MPPPPPHTHTHTHTQPLQHAIHVFTNHVNITGLLTSAHRSALSLTPRSPPPPPPPPPLTQCPMRQPGKQRATCQCITVDVCALMLCACVCVCVCVNV
ncbi:unnamed protein product [Boreogadus saida]